MNVEVPILDPDEVKTLFQRFWDEGHSRGKRGHSLCKFVYRKLRVAGATHVQAFSSGERVHEEDAHWADVEEQLYKNVVALIGHGSSLEELLSEIKKRAAQTSAKDATEFCEHLVEIWNQSSAALEHVEKALEREAAAKEEAARIAEELQFKKLERVERRRLKREEREKKAEALRQEEERKRREYAESPSGKVERARRDAEMADKKAAAAERHRQREELKRQQWLAEHPRRHGTA